MQRSETRSDLYPLLYGHRGAAGEAPENTVTGFAYAQELGIQAFELDIRLSADKELVVIHDATVDRTTDAVGPVASFTAAQLGRLDARAAFPDWPESAGVPMLAEVLDSLAGTPRLEIEIKCDTPDRLERVVRQLLAMLDQFRIAERTTVSSFDPVALEIVQRLAPTQARGFIGNYDEPTYLATALRLGCSQVDIRLSTGSPGVVQQAQAESLKVTGWPGNTAEALQVLFAWGVDGVTTDHPTMALAYLQEQEESS